MNKDFPRMITYLRKERKLSQKQAAEELGVSQALLSHYEKGLRECRLDFVVRAADYYGVSCDYLLGRSADRSGEAGEAPEAIPSRRQSAAQNANRRLIGSALNAIFELAAFAKNRRLDHTVSNYFMLALYQVLRRLYSANGSNPQEPFTVPQTVYSGYAEAAMRKNLADIESMTNPDSESYLQALGEIDASPDRVAQEHPEAVSEISNVLRQAENAIAKMR